MMPQSIEEAGNSDSEEDKDQQLNMNSQSGIDIQQQ